MNMISGLFRGHPITQPSKQQLAHSLDQFAEFLSCDMALPDIADAMGVTRGTSCVLLRMLCEKMGAQAQ